MTIHLDEPCREWADDALAVTILMDLVVRLPNLPEDLRMTCLSMGEHCRQRILLLYAGQTERRQ